MAKRTRTQGQLQEQQINSELWTGSDTQPHYANQLQLQGLKCIRLAQGDILKINGFDEQMAWGGLDREIGVRLVNAGIKPKHVRYNAIVLHLDHKRGYKSPELVQQNKALRGIPRERRHNLHASRHRPVARGGMTL